MLNLSLSVRTNQGLKSAHFSRSPRVTAKTPHCAVENWPLRTAAAYLKKSKNDFFIGLISVSSSSRALRTTPEPITP
jgi:hypothetical protein